METPDQRHNRYQTQAKWTRQIREHLLQECSETTGSILDVGCGTGAVTTALPGKVFGLDILLQDLKHARQVSQGPSYLAGDALTLPFPDSRFSLVCCHFLLLWLPDPRAALSEMIRVLQPGGDILIFAEPDYGGRIDYPPPLDELGRLQLESLHRQGTDPEIGRKLRSLLAEQGLSSVKCGVMGGEWQNNGSLPQDIHSEWQILTSDMRMGLSAEELNRYINLDRHAWLEGTRILYVPTFYARGTRPASA